MHCSFLLWAVKPPQGSAEQGASQPAAGQRRGEGVVVLLLSSTAGSFCTSARDTETSQELGAGDLGQCSLIMF